MEKKLENYIGSYFGCQCLFIYETRSRYPELKYDRRTGNIVGIIINGVVNEVDILAKNGTQYRRRVEDVKIILRRISDMTDAEQAELQLLKDMMEEDNHNCELEIYAAMGNKCRKLGIDIDGLLDEEFAITPGELKTGSIA